MLQGVVASVDTSALVGKTPPPGSTVTVHYVGTLTNGNEFDSSRSRGKPFQFVIGKGQVIKGWDEGVAQMSKGQRAKLTCTPDYAYGERGFPPVIPANSSASLYCSINNEQPTNTPLATAALIFDVELLDFQ